MSRKTKTVPLSKISDIQAALKKKAATPKNISLQNLVHSLAKPIQDMLDAGYGYEDVSEVFQGHGVDVAASGIRTYHRKAVTTIEQLGTETSAETSAEKSPELNGSSEATPPIEQDASLPEPVTKSSPTTSKTTRAKKTPDSDNIKSQFNLTDRSSL